MEHDDNTDGVETDTEKENVEMVGSINDVALDDEVNEVISEALLSTQTTEIPNSQQTINLSVSNSNMQAEQSPWRNETSINAAIGINDENIEVIRKQLCFGKRKNKWQQYSVSDVNNVLQSADKMYEEMIGQELHDIVNYLNIFIRSKEKTPIKQSLRKAEKVNKICEILGRQGTLVIPQKRCRPKKVRSLAALSICELRKSSYPKVALAAAFAKCTWPAYKENWFNKSTYAQNIKILNGDRNSNKHIEKDSELRFSPVYSPEYVTERDQRKSE